MAKQLLVIIIGFPLLCLGPPHVSLSRPPVSRTVQTVVVVNVAVVLNQVLDVVRLISFSFSSMETNGGDVFAVTALVAFQVLGGWPVPPRAPHPPMLVVLLPRSRRALKSKRNTCQDQAPEPTSCIGVGTPWVSSALAASAAAAIDSNPTQMPLSLPLLPS